MSKIPKLKLVKELGEGAHGKAILVKDIANNKYYVVKQTKITDESKREIYTLEKIKPSCNPYLVCIKEFRVNKDEVDIYLEYVPKTIELYSMLERNFQLFNPKIKFLIVRNLVKGLLQLHSLGVVHRDIKPENILLNYSTLNTRYIDYGTACVREGNQPSCKSEYFLETPGTPIYMSPQLFKMGVDKRLSFDAVYHVKNPSFEVYWNARKADDVWALYNYYNSLFSCHDFFGRYLRTS